MENILRLKRISKEDQLIYGKVVKKELDQVNTVRAYYLLLLGILIEPLLIAFYDIPGIMSYGYIKNYNYLYLILHSLLLLLSIFGAIYCYRYSKGKTKKRDNNKFFEILLLGLPAIYMSIVAFINGLDQQTVPSISLYIMIVLVVVVFIYYKPAKSAILLTITQFFFILGMVLFQKDTSIVILNIFNGTIIATCAWVISIINYYSFFNGTMNRELLRKANQKLQILSNTDYLTEIYNRRFGMKRLEEEFSLSKRSGLSFGLLILDIDDFKTINDQYGHIVGDETLVEVVNIIKSHIRKEDVIVRYGGEEFIILLPNTHIEGVSITGEKIRNTIKDHSFNINSHSFNISISLGGVAYPLYKANSIVELIERADKNLYISKNNGKNKLTIK